MRERVCMIEASNGHGCVSVAVEPVDANQTSEFETLFESKLRNGLPQTMQYSNILRHTLLTESRCNVKHMTYDDVMCVIGELMAAGRTAAANALVVIAGHMAKVIREGFRPLAVFVETPA